MKSRAGVTGVCNCPRARHVHGSHGMYSKHLCGCFPCRFAESSRRSVGVLGDGELVARVGTARRIEALHALGWSGPRIAARLGCTGEAVRQNRSHDGLILCRTADRVADVFESMSAVVPVGPGAGRVRAWARRQGWLPPLAWDDDTIDDPAALPYIPAVESALLLDEVAIEEALIGRPVTLTKAEREEAARRGRARGMSVRETALMLRMPERSVVRDLKAAAA